MSDLEEERNYKVYKLTSPSNKVYIGITNKKDPNKRWKNGKGYLLLTKEGNYRQPYIARAILKYGWENLKREILFENLTKEEAKLKEIELISFYDSTNKDKGYNIQSGSGGSLGVSPNESTRKKLSVSVKISKADSKDNLFRKINQYDLDGNLIKTWSNCFDLNEAGFDDYTIRKSCERDGFLVTQGFQWRFSDDCKDIGKYYSHFKDERIIYEVNTNGDVLNQYISRAECSRQIGYHLHKSTMLPYIYIANERYFVCKKDLDKVTDGFTIVRKTRSDKGIKKKMEAL